MKFVFFLLDNQPSLLSNQIPTEPIYRPDVCYGQRDGTYDDPEDCGAYYFCSNGITHHMRCPYGTVWNRKMRGCSFASASRNVNCQSTQGNLISNKISNVINNFDSKLIQDDHELTAQTKSNQSPLSYGPENIGSTGSSKSPTETNIRAQEESNLPDDSEKIRQKQYQKQDNTKYNQLLTTNSRGQQRLAAEKKQQPINVDHQQQISAKLPSRDHKTAPLTHNYQQQQHQQQQSNDKKMLVLYEVNRPTRNGATSSSNSNNKENNIDDEVKQNSINYDNVYNNNLNNNYYNNNYDNKHNNDYNNNDDNKNEGKNTNVVVGSDIQPYARQATGVVNQRLSSSHVLPSSSASSLTTSHSVVPQFNAVQSTRKVPVNPLQMHLISRGKYNSVLPLPSPSYEPTLSEMFESYLNSNSADISKLPQNSIATEARAINNAAAAGTAERAALNLLPHSSARKDMQKPAFYHDTSTVTPNANRYGSSLKPIVENNGELIQQSAGAIVHNIHNDASEHYEETAHKL